MHDRYKFNFKTIKKKFLSDSNTSVELYLKLRDVFPNTLLLEMSSKTGYIKNDLSIFCINPVSEFILDKDVLKISYPNNIHKNIFINKKFNIRKLIENFFRKFKNYSSLDSYYTGLYGYITYDSIQHFESINFHKNSIKEYNIPKIRLGFYKNIILLYHLKNEINIIEHQFDIDHKNNNKTYISKLIELIKKKNFEFFPFNTVGNKTSNLTDFEYEKMVDKGIKYCLRGDVFQIVLSRQFQQKFIGDEFNVYRALRFINPSPYLFYFDYGNYKLFGSSPESQLVIKNKIAYINPIAGTIKRSKYNKDEILSKILMKDPKENSEHVMLVDLARNDLSKNSTDVEVNSFKKIQIFSHVLHMVSKVSGKISKNSSLIKIFIDTFPAGTLSGAPKYKAMQLIDEIENQHRGAYGGAIGFFHFGKNPMVNTSIIIRSFVSKNNTLFFQAGAGIVFNSNKKKELEEVNNKLMALKKSIDLAKNI